MKFLDKSVNSKTQGTAGCSSNGNCLVIGHNDPIFDHLLNKELILNSLTDNSEKEQLYYLNDMMLNQVNIINPYGPATI